MEVAPPSQSGSRIQEVGDRLIVRFRAPNSWVGVLFLSTWLAFWTAAGIGVSGSIGRGDGTAFLVIWLCMWAVGEGLALLTIAFQLFGREVLLVTPQQLEERKEIGRFARTRVYDAALVEDVRAARTPTDEGERQDFCLQVVYGGKKLRIGEGMQEGEAEYVASAVLEQIRPRARWSGERRADPHAEPLHAPAPSRSKAGIFRALVFPAIVVSALVWLAVQTIRSPSHPTTPTSTQVTPVGPPSAQAFSDPREYASALTLHALTSGQMRVLGQPDCGESVTWKAWVCRVSAKSLNGPYAGRSLIYRCYPYSMPQPGSRQKVEGTLCGPEHPPPITGTTGS